MDEKKKGSLYEKRIMITAPSLDVKDNVSGVSTLVSDIMSSSKYRFIHFQLGSKDAYKKRNLGWMVDQVVIYVKLLFTTLFTRFELLHLNVGLEKPSILRDSVVLFIVNRIFRKKVILHVHGGYYLMNAPGPGIIHYLLNSLVRNASVIIVLSELEKAELTKRYGVLPIYVFANAVDTDSILRAKGRIAAKKIRFIFMARIIKMKGIYTISDSLKYLQPYFDRFTLDIYGAGAELNDWRAAMDKYPGFVYTYRGVVTGKEKWDALNSADVLLLPSLHGEGMPIAMIEAMTAGCAVIVTDVASVKSVIDDGFNGMLLSESLPELLAKKMENAILGRVDIKMMGENAKQYVLNNLTLSEYINKLEHLYAEL